MSAQRIEIQHNDPEQVRAYVSEAVAIADELVPAEHRSPELLVKILDLVAGKTIQQVQPPPMAIGLPRMDVPRGHGH